MKANAAAWGAALGIALLGCGPVGSGSAPGSVAAGLARESDGADALPPELLAVLRQGPGGPALDDGIEFAWDGDAGEVRPLRIVLQRDGAWGSSLGRPLGPR